MWDLKGNSKFISTNLKNLFNLLIEKNNLIELSVQYNIYVNY